MLRQERDVILIGEIRDLETAEIACRAANTGRLVLSTLHTDDAFGAIIRLLDLAVDRSLVRASLSLIVPQRLARRVCQQCKEPYTPPTQTMQTFRMHNQARLFDRAKAAASCQR